MRTLSTPVWSTLVLILTISSISSARMSRVDEGHFSEPHTETEQSNNMPIMDQKSIQPIYPQEKQNFPIPGGDNSDNRNSQRIGGGRAGHTAADESLPNDPMTSSRVHGRQLPPTSHYDNDRFLQQTEYSRQRSHGQRSHGTSDYNYRPGPTREYGGRATTGNNYDLNEVPGGSYDIYGVHEQARPTRPPEYTSGRWPAEDSYGYNRGQGSIGVGDSRASYQHQYPQQSPYPYGQDRERDYRPRQPYQPPEPVDVSVGGRRYDNVNPPPRYPQSYEEPYERSSYS